MSEIKAGDLVMVVRDCCGHWGGRIFRVDRFLCPSRIECGKCTFSSTTLGPVAVNADFVYPGAWAIPVAWLKKIDPPALPESVTEREELTA